MCANRPLRKPEDFMGLKMRIQASKVSAAQMRAFGAIPVPIAFSEFTCEVNQPGGAHEYR
jgi:C4-dicarboxylate-binding protein DctP